MEYFLIVIMAIIAVAGWLKPIVAPPWFTKIVVFLIVLSVAIQLVIQKKINKEKKTLKYIGKLKG